MPQPGRFSTIGDDTGPGGAGLGIAAIGFAVGLVGATIAGAIAVVVTNRQLGEPLGFGEQAAVQAGLWLGLLGVPLVWARTGSRGGPARALALRFRPIDALLGLGAGIAAVVGTTIGSLWLDDTDQEKLNEIAEETINAAGGWPRTAAMAVLLCVLTPVVEEVFFRGLLFRSLRDVLPIALALPPASVLFGLVHFSGKDLGGATIVTQLGLLALFGALLCALVHRTSRLGPAIVAHGVFNAVTVASVVASR